jgi:hypothetical protein
MVTQPFYDKSTHVCVLTTLRPFCDFYLNIRVWALCFINTQNGRKLDTSHNTDEILNSFV